MLEYLQFSYKKILAAKSSARVAPANQFTLASAKSRGSEVVEDGYTDTTFKTYVVENGETISTNN